jgi:hypothetical protein
VAYFHGLAIMHDPKLSPDLSPAERWVATWIFTEEYADDNGPKPLQRSVTTIAEGTGQSERTVRRAVRRLADLGYLEQQVVHLTGKLAEASWWSPGRLTVEVGRWGHHDPTVGSPWPGGGATVAPIELREKQGQSQDPSCYPPAARRRRPPARPRATERRGGGDPQRVGDVVTGMLPWLLDRPKRDEP